MTTASTLTAPRTWLFRRRSAATRIRNTAPRPRPQPLHEALAVGLGCISFDFEMQPPAEWR